MCMSKKPKVPKLEQPTPAQQATQDAQAQDAERQRAAAAQGRGGLVNPTTGYTGVPNQLGVSAPQGGTNLGQ